MALTRFRMAAAGVWSRTATRARKADWLAVAGELAIVVFGILIAFQLDRWADHWRQAQERQLYLERLSEESAGNIEALARLTRDFNARTREVLGVERALNDPIERVRIAHIEGYGCAALQLPAARLQTAAVDEAADAASLELMPDAELRRLIHTVAANNRFFDRQLDYFRASFQRYGEKIDRYTVWRLDPANGHLSCATAVDRLAADAEAASLIGRIYRDRARFSDFYAEQLDGYRALRQRALCLHDETC